MFRSWSKPYLNSDDSEYRMCYQNDINNDYPFRHYTFSELLDSKNNKLMQSTMVRDINNKMVYEGDIVIWSQAEGGFLPPDTNKYTCVVVWRDDQFLCMDQNSSSWFQVFTPHISVIGNIFENPELLPNSTSL